MPYRDRATVESWIADFASSHGDSAVDIAVLDKNYQSGPNSGLVVVTLRNAPTITYVHPVIRGGEPRWLATFEPRNEGVDMDVAQLQALALELQIVAEVCEYLQHRTDEVRQLQAVPTP